MVEPASAMALGALAGQSTTMASFLPWLAAGGTAAAGAGSLMSATAKSPDAPDINVPSATLPMPAQSPNAKPQRKSQQQSFLSGASMAQQSGSAPSTGKTLLGA